MYKPEHVTAWRRITDFVHEHEAKVGIQLAHAGRKGSTKPMWEGIDSLDSGNWPIIDRSNPYGESWPTPMNRAEMDRIRDAFIRDSNGGYSV